MHGTVGPSNPLLPASELTLIYFVSHLAQTLSYKTVKLYLIGVQDLHRELDFPLHIHQMHRLQKVLTGIKRLSPPRQVDRFSITIHTYIYITYPNLLWILLWNWIFPSTSTKCIGYKRFLPVSSVYPLPGRSIVFPLLYIHTYTLLTLIYFVSHLAQTLSYKTVKLYLIGVQDLHRELDFPLHIHQMHRLQKILTGIKRLSPPRQVDRFSITIQTLTTIHSLLKPELSSNLDHVMLWAAFTLAFFGLLRASEFTCNGPCDPEVHLSSQDITLVPNTLAPSHMLVRLKQSKTDPFRQGHTLMIAKSTSHICSVMAMKDYLLHVVPCSPSPNPASG